MDGSYEFLVDLKRLMVAFRRLEIFLYILNAALIGTLAYIGSLFMGLSAFFNFYWEESLFSLVPALFSIIIGLLVAKLLGRSSRSDLFAHLDDISEKTKAAYDNRDSDSVVMESLAVDVKRSLSKVRAADLVNNRRIKFGDRSVPIFQAKAGGLLLLLAFTAVYSQGLAGEEVPPQPFRPLSDLRDRAMALFEEEVPADEASPGRGISGEIYGKPSLAILEEVNLELVLYPGSAAGFRARETSPMEGIFLSSEPGEGVAVATDLYIESLPPQHREIIKRYFENLARG
ncbi:hypothetical protein [Candidatus Methanocrinis natronophilus]|uniref:DUF4175 domain-containing protein n=1 Tax=Candidatus Methanocrinis natronophilus TaxID=3033396 RepID=A0ABT5X747_9EURY|nr:hypothetical protein [Candidatus Methanocrinis natronophilus]MDF0590512.1 hypothetical protein [Candidatus Methanocrinis natronophilus]